MVLFFNSASQEMVIKTTIWVPEIGLSKVAVNYPHISVLEGSLFELVYEALIHLPLLSESWSM